LGVTNSPADLNLKANKNVWTGRRSQKQQVNVSNKLRQATFYFNFKCTINICRKTHRQT